MKIYSTGYTGKDINDLKPMLEALGAVLIDVRFSPASQVIFWRQEYLKALLGKNYYHIQNLGNRTFKEGKITIENMRLGIETLISIDKDCVIFCACEKKEKCHRKLIIKELEETGYEIEELETWKTRDPATQMNLFK